MNMVKVEDAAGSMNERQKAAVIDFLYQLADDDLVFGHRSSEWLGLAPDLEEDIAFSSISQDEVGHAAFFYGLISELTGESADALAFQRPAAVRRNARLLEQPNGDWAYTIARSFLYNAFEQVRLETLLHSSYVPLTQGATKILREERYHFLHMDTWFERLGIAGGEARSRLEAAVQAVWGQLPDLFELGQHKDILIEEGIFPATEDTLYQAWKNVVEPVFHRAGFPWPGDVALSAAPGMTEPGQNEIDKMTNGRHGQHTEHLDELLGTMTEVYRSDVSAKW